MKILLCVLGGIKMIILSRRSVDYSVWSFPKNKYSKIIINN